MKMLRKVTAFALALVLALSLCPAGFAAPEVVSDFCTESEWENLKETNIERVENGLVPLSTFPLLNDLARVRAEETLESFSHTRPDGSEFWSILKENGVEYYYCRENIAYGYYSALEVHLAWMDSEGHRTNILQPGNVHLSTGRADNNWAQLFVEGCTPDSMRIISGTSGGHYSTGTDISDMDEVIAITCDEHGESYMPLIGEICSGYDPLLADVTQTVTVSLEQYDLSASFDVTLDYVPQNVQEGDIYYKWVGDGYSVSLFYGGDGDDLVIPSTVNGQPVVEIAESLFDRNYILGEVTLPDTLVRIGDFAFQGATIEGELYIPSGVSYIGDSALSYIKGCTAFNVDPRNPYYTSIDGVLYNAELTEIINYPLAKEDTVLELPESVTMVKTLSLALNWEGSLTAIVVPNPECDAEDIAFFGTRATVYCNPNSPLWSVVESDAATCEVRDISLASEPFAYDITAEEAADILHSMGLFKGTNNGYELERVPNRMEAVTMLVRLLGMEEIAQKYPREHPFTDVQEWASPNVGYAYENGLTNGTSATTFGALEESSCVQYITFVLRALGYSDAEGDFVWNRPWELSDRIGLTNGQYNSADTPLTRGDMVLITCAALECWMADKGVTLGTELFGEDWK